MLVIGAVAGAAVTLASVGILVFRAGIPLSEAALRQRVVSALADNLHAQVELSALHVSLRHGFSVSGEGLIIRHRRQPDVALIAVKQFTVASSVRSLLRNRVDRAVLEGLAITIPRARDSAENNGPDTTPLRSARVARFSRTLQSLEIAAVVADESALTVLPKRPDGHPRVWSMHSLRLGGVRLDRSMSFTSVLTNAVPPGEIVTSGRFGPWNADSPGASRVQGDFTFARADLSVFKGISGLLSAKGRYNGTLDRIAVSGETTTPDFTITLGAHPVQLETRYQAVVDATNGDTTLERVDATFGNTSFVASGGVYDLPGVAGRQLTLDVTMDKGQLEDVLPLTVNAPKPTMTGSLELKAHVELAPGQGDVIDRLSLNGEFGIGGGRFTDPGVQQKVRLLSGRARGKPGDQLPVRSDFAGHFLLENGHLQLTPLQFDVPGAVVQLNGRYGLRQGSLAFAGQMYMDASVSQAVGGWKSLLLKPFDALFRKKGRTFIPLTITGFRDDPKFGVDRRRLFNKSAAPMLPTPTPASASRKPAVRGR